MTEEEFRITLCLYIDDFEVANPLGTSKRKHKLCAIYWVLGNLHPKYRSSLHSIQLALLSKVSYIKEYGYSEIHVVDGYPPDLLHDLLEGVVPLELALCLKGLISKGYFTLEVLNTAIKQFPYGFSDRTSQPQLITKIFYSK